MAFLTSCFVPGTGQMYNNQVDLGLQVFFGEALLLGSGIIMARQDSEAAQNFGRILIVGAAVIHIAQLVQAPRYSIRLNDMNGYNNRNVLTKLEIGVQASSQPVFIKLNLN